MSFFDAQNPGIGGLEELTDAEQLFVQNLAGLSYAEGDIIYIDSGGDFVKLAVGSNGQVLTLASGVPSWASASAGVVSNITADPNPAVVGTSYFCDTSGGGFNVTLPDVSAGNDGEIIRVVLSDATNTITVTTVSGTDMIGTETSQAISEAATGITVQANNTNSTWEIIQDSRSDIPVSNLTFYGLTEAGAVGGYNRLTLSTDDSDFSNTATDVSSGSITGAAQSVGNWVADAGALTGLLTETNANFTFNVRRTAGSGTAEFYCELYHRNSGGTETLIGTSGVSSPISSASYVQRTIQAFVSEQDFVSTDYVVIKFFANRISGGSDPTYDVQVEGITSPARMTISVSSSLIPHASLTGLLNDDHTQYTLISSQAGAPSSTPTRVGELNIDTTADRIYISTDTTGSGDWDILITGNQTASDTVAGIVELATITETNTGTDATKAITPDGLAGSDFGIRYVQVVPIDFTTNTSTGDGKFYFHIPAAFDGMNLVEVHAEVITAGTTGTTDIQIHNVTQAADMLSTKITIDSGETGSDTAAAAAVIDTANDDVAENDLIRIDVDAVSTTPAQGMLVTMGFQLP